MPDSLTNDSDFESLLALSREKPVLLYKHSTTCPVSAMAKQELQVFLDERPDIPSYEVKVIESRSLSQAIASHFNIKHESPQIFIIFQAVVKWHASHGEIHYYNLVDQFPNPAKE